MKSPLSVAPHGLRPIERLWDLGLLTPASERGPHGARHGRRYRSGAAHRHIGQPLPLIESCRRERQLPPAAALGGIREFAWAWAAAAALARNQDLWGEMKLLALMLPSRRRSGEADHAAWDALAAATRGGAAALGLEREVGTLESGKWADLCCVDLGGPATQPLRDPVAQLVFRRRP